MLLEDASYINNRFLVSHVSQLISHQPCKYQPYYILIENLTYLKLCQFNHNSMSYELYAIYWRVSLLTILQYIVTVLVTGYDHIIFCQLFLTQHYTKKNILQAHFFIRETVCGVIFRVAKAFQDSLQLQQNSLYFQIHYSLANGQYDSLPPVLFHDLQPCSTGMQIIIAGP